jgi:hypothetical protein
MLAKKIRSNSAKRGGHNPPTKATNDRDYPVFPADEEGNSGGDRYKF